MPNLVITRFLNSQAFQLLFSTFSFQIQVLFPESSALNAKYKILRSTTKSRRTYCLILEARKQGIKDRVDVEVRIFLFNMELC